MLWIPVMERPVAKPCQQEKVFLIVNADYISIAPPLHLNIENGHVTQAQPLAAVPDRCHLPLLLLLNVCCEFFTFVTDITLRKSKRWIEFIVKNVIVQKVLYTTNKTTVHLCNSMICIQVCSCFGLSSAAMALYGQNWSMCTQSLVCITPSIWGWCSCLPRPSVMPARPPSNLSSRHNRHTAFQVNVLRFII